MLSRLGQVFALVLLLGVLLAPSAAASGSSGSPPPSLSTDDLSPAQLQARGIAGDWAHVTQVIGWLRYRPRARVVYLVGGSATRESVVGEREWAAQLSRMSGRKATAFVLATACQTFAEDELIVRALPRNRGGVLINVGTSRFIMLHKPDTIPPHSVRRTAPPVWYQHHYDRRSPLSRAQKRALAARWIEKSFPLFQERLQDRLADLESVVQACERRGLRCALLDMPLDLPVIGDDFDEALAMYRQACLELATRHGIKFIRFNTGIGLRNADFYDLQHLLKSGRAKWQARLSREVLRKHLL